MHRTLKLRHAALCLAAVITPCGERLGAADASERPLRILQAQEATFPPSLASQGIFSGWVRVVLHVDAAGHLLDHLVLAYTREEFANELALTLPRWTFEPAWDRNGPVGTRAEIVFAFESRGAVVSIDGMTSVSMAARGLPEQSHSLEARLTELDRPLAALTTVSPAHPGRDLGPGNATGTATIDFYVDTTGKPRMPVAFGATHEAYVIAAAEALMRWRFEVPTRHGQPVNVRAQQTFNFGQTKRP